jgi:hypothetical protein
VKYNIHSVKNQATFELGTKTVFLGKINGIYKGYFATVLGTPYGEGTETTE